MANDMAKPAKTDATTRQQMRRDNLKAKVLGQSEHNIPVFVMTCAKYAKLRRMDPSEWKMLH